ncbi:MAG: cryptochrome/photolyase family protein [Limisphaerales bacterium]
MANNSTIVWFRLDLRLSDQPALTAAIKRSEPVIPVFIHDPESEGKWRPGAASDWWLHHSLKNLDEELRAVGSRLIVRRGDSLTELRSLVKETGATAVYWNRRYEPLVIARDANIKQALGGDGVEVQSFNGALLHEPWTIQNKAGNPFRVFTPYWRTCVTLDVAKPLARPRKIGAPKKWPGSERLDLLPKLNWAKGFKVWSPGEQGAQSNLKRFLSKAFVDYGEGRDRPDRVGTSRLSPHLHFGEISPRQIWAAVSKLPQWRHSQFLAEIGWREFAHHLLYHFPQTAEEPLRPEFKKFRWRKNAAALKAWQSGQTGYPIVDAGMRELWTTGWMHNRVRMIVASFLIKDLLIDWREGTQWFWDALVDADLASNTLGWQWTAGCGADASPFFRIFNPTSQGEKFDGQGDYVRRWCPEIARLPDRWLHQPWNTPAAALQNAGIVLGRDYPEPIVNHGTARHIALEAFQRIKGA